MHSIYLKDNIDKPKEFGIIEKLDYKIHLQIFDTKISLDQMNSYYLR